MAESFSIYTATPDFSTGTSTYTYSFDKTASVTADTGGDTVLGQTAGDVFKDSDNVSYTYGGVFSLFGVPGGFYATSGGVTYYFYIGGSSSLHGTVSNVTFTPDNTANPQSEWNLVTGAPNCFCAGTALRTPDGDIAVENIVPGTMLLTANGARPVRWLGRSTVATRFADPLLLAPIRIKAGALAENTPLRDLSVSPCHALFIDGVLIQAGALVNGGSILRETNLPETFTYYHVELAAHEILLAEGAAAESFVDNVSRIRFDNVAEYEALGPQAAIAEMDLPRAKAHRQIPAAIRASIAARAARFAPETIAA